MAGEQDVLAPNPGGYSYDLNGGGEERGVWGGKSPHLDDSGYTGGWHNIEGDGYSIPVPNDPQAYQAAMKWSSSGRQEDVDRYRQMGADAANRDPVQLEYGRSNNMAAKADQGLMYGEQARQQQQGVVNAMAGAAAGNAPSRAELLGKNLISQSLQSQLAGAASARGGALGQASAMRNAQQGAAAFQQQGANQLSALRADEMERARNAWGQQVGQMRGQDYQYSGAANAIAQTEAQKAQYQGQLAAQQRALNQQAQMGYEGMAWDTNNAALQAGLGQSAQEQQAYQFGKQMDQQDADRQQRYMGAAVGAIGDLGSTAANAGKQPSDMRTKVPLLLDIPGKKPKAAAPNWLDDFMRPEQAQAANDREADEHQRRMRSEDLPQVDGSLISRDDPYAGPTPGGITREDPYGSGQVFYSDPKAKNDLSYGGRSSPSSAPAAPPGGGGPKGKRQMTPEEMMRAADAMGSQMQSQHEARMAQGPAVSADILEDANRRGAAFPYAYKPEYVPAGQDQGEVNYGPSADELEKNPLTATAIKKDPNGMRMVDMPKLVKVNTGSIANLQQQIDELKGRRHG